MTKIPIVITKNSGGQSSSNKEGVDNSFAYSRHIDFRKDPNLLSILPETTKETGSTVTALITDMIQLPSGKIVAIDTGGGVYVRTTAGSWSKDGTTLQDTAHGMIYNLQHDTIYIPGLTTMHSITNADGRFGGSFTVNSNTFFHQVDQASINGHASTYTTTGSITETATHKLTIVPNIEPLYSVLIWVTTKGTGDLVLTMHDGANNELGEVTIANASLTNGAYNEFIFNTVRMNAKPNASQYHFHITHPSGTASTIGTLTASDFSTVDFVSYSSRLVNPVNDFHPIYQFLQYYIILNERYVAAWEPISQSAPSAAEFNQHRLVLPSGYEGTSGAVYNDYFAIAAEKRSTSLTNEFQEGKIFFWDGFATTYNFVIDIPEGAPYSLFSHKGVLYWYAGGGWWAFNGGEPVKLFQMPFTDTEYTDIATYFINYPHAQTVRNGILLGAFPSATTSTTAEHGIYSYGSRMKNYPDAFGYSYTMSTGSRTNGSLQLGVVKNFGDKLFFSWRDDTSYGVDIVSPTSDPFGSAVWESLITDLGRPDKDKEAVSLRITFKTLPTGATITPKYKINRESSWVTGTAAVAGDSEILLNINKRFKEIQIGMDLVATTTTPEIISVTLIYESLQSERD
jgi:hypothetical protein